MLIEDMQVRNLAVGTQQVYVQQVSLFAQHFHKSPEVLGPEEIRTYQIYLTNEKRLTTNSMTAGRTISPMPCPRHSISAWSPHPTIRAFTIRG